MVKSSVVESWKACAAERVKAAAVRVINLPVVGQLSRELTKTSKQMRKSPADIAFASGPLIKKIASANLCDYVSYAQ